MGESIRNKKLVYHLTSVGNLPSIVEHGLLPRATIAERKLTHVDVADAGILDGRGDALAQRVPFHFMHCTPFDFAVFHQAPEHRYALVTVRRSVARSQEWKIVPRHPLADGEAYQILDWDAGIEAIAWDQLDKFPRPWSEDRVCKHACMAEALSPGPVPLSNFFTVFFETDEDMRAACKTSSALKSLKPIVNAKLFPKRSPKPK